MNWLPIFLYFFLPQIANAAGPQLLIGATLPLSGSMIERGQMVKDGINAALQEALRSNPALKNSVKLEILDDKGDPRIAAENAKKLTLSLNAQVLIGCVGEQTCAAVEEVSRQARVPLLAPINANDEVCKPDSLAYCFHSSYADEAKAISRQIKSLGIKKVNLWTSADLNKYQEKIIRAFENSQLTVKTKNLTSQNKIDTFEVNAQSLTDEAHILLLNNDDAIKAIKIIKNRTPSSMIGGFSSIEPYRWLQSSQGYSTGVFIAHTMPNPDLANTKLVKRYQAALADCTSCYLPYEHSQLEIYVATRLLMAFIAQGNMSRQSIIKALSQHDISIDEFGIRFNGRIRFIESPPELSIVNRNGLLIQ